MLPTRHGSFRLFRVSGIEVSVHWLWFVALFWFLSAPPVRFSSPSWNLATFLTLFAIVLLHELGHVLACRQVGGQADHIVLWLLGGAAFVQPPPRPGAVLWSIAAGPLVNVLLVPITLGCLLLGHVAGGVSLFAPDVPDNLAYLRWVVFINLVILVFNLLPIYPLDGGQIVQALLWFAVGRARSLYVVSILSLVVGGGVALLLLVMAALDLSFVFLALVFAFITVQSLVGLRASQILSRLERAPRHKHAACPSCDAPALAGTHWVCDECGERFDTFLATGVCPRCHAEHPETVCPECGRTNPVADWLVPEPAASSRPADEAVARGAESRADVPETREARRG